MSAISINSVPRIVSAAQTQGKPSLRLTRRGRVVLLGLPLLLLAIAVLVLSGFLTAPLKAGVNGGEAGVGSATSKVTVNSGESIWSIAASSGVDRDVRDVVAEIVQLNELSTSVLSPGQQIFVPTK